MKMIPSSANVSQDLQGASGSGKSTIIGLLERWYNPSRGDITLDGTPLTNLNLQWLRTNLRLVQQVSFLKCSDFFSLYDRSLMSLQEPVLFNGTVLENICSGLFGTPWEHASPEDRIERVKQAAKTAFAHDFIETLPQKYETRIGERGGLLSGGQKQRIAIARSIISQPSSSARRGHKRPGPACGGYCPESARQSIERPNHNRHRAQAQDNPNC